MAYKSLEDIIDVITESVDIIEVIKPVYNFKAWGLLSFWVIRGTLAVWGRRALLFLVAGPGRIDKWRSDVVKCLQEFWGRRGDK